MKVLKMTLSIKELLLCLLHVRYTQQSRIQQLTAQVSKTQRLSYTLKKTLSDNDSYLLCPAKY